MTSTFTVDKGYDVALIFFNLLWPFVEPHTLNSDEIKTVNMLFFIDICNGTEASPEWRSAIFKAKKIKREDLPNAMLSDTDLFLCTTEFCKIYNEHWSGKLKYVLSLLEKMKSDPREHSKEWQLWNEAKAAVLINHMTVSSPFEW